jgi:hypothetical protein
LECSKSLVLLQVRGWTLATALCKTFLLRMLNDSSAGQNPPKGCSADRRRRRRRRGRRRRGRRIRRIRRGGGGGGGECTIY